MRRGRPARFSDLRQHLRQAPDAADLAFVSYFCGDSTTTVFTYVPQTDVLAVARIPLGIGTLEETARRLRSDFNGDPDAFPAKPAINARLLKKRDVTYLQQLAPHLLAFLPHAANRPLLCVAGDGPLHVLPLAALTTDDGKHLATKHAVVHVLSASVLLHSLARHTQRFRNHPTRAGEVFCAGVAAVEDLAPEMLESDVELLRAAGWQATGISGPAVTRDEILRNLEGRPIAHLTCHGHFDAAEPMDSGLLLASQGQRPSKIPTATSILTRQKHLLSARHLSASPIDVDLLTLRACSAGLRDDRAGGDLEGLTQALLYAGVRAVITTLWNVNEVSSRTLLIDFYRRLASGGEPIWRSLWAAQRAMLEDPEDPQQTHLYHWAPHVLIGDWRVL
jgi:CHAT domain-containing protein